MWTSAVEATADVHVMGIIAKKGKIAPVLN
jgi:hypothetical protein